MATTTFHISLPAQLGKAIEKEIKEGYYSPSEYFKMLYRKQREYEEKDFEETIRNYKKEKKAGKLKVLKSVDELFEE